MKERKVGFLVVLAVVVVVAVQHARRRRPHAYRKG